MTARFLLLAFTSCLPIRVPERPTYDSTCLPSDPTFVELAQSTRDLPDIGTISADPEQALAQALALAERRGLTIRKKKTTEVALWDGFSTTLPGVILLATDWDAKPVEARAWILWHEVGVHGAQYDRMGPHRFLAWYAVPEGRWSLEVPAYAFLFRLQLHFGEHPDDVRDRIQATAEAMPTKYALAGMPRCMAVEETARLLRAGAGL